MASPTQRLTGLSRARNAFRARGRNSILYGTSCAAPAGVVALGAEFITQVGERVRLAVAVRREGGQGSGGQVGEVQAGVGQLGAYTGYLR